MTTNALMPEGLERVETGPVKFGDDWPGVFFRGDDALFTALTVDQAARVLMDRAVKDKSDQHMLLIAQLQGLAVDMRSCSVGDTGWPPFQSTRQRDDNSAMLVLQAAGLVALAQFNIPTDVQELLLRGDPTRGIKPGALLGLIRLLLRKVPD